MRRLWGQALLLVLAAAAAAFDHATRAMKTPLHVPPGLNYTSPPRIPDAESFRVDPMSIPGLPEGVGPQYAGYMPVNDGATPGQSKGYLFWWLHESEMSNDDPLVIWLNGGPGCSSLLGMLFEVGPYTMQADGGLRINENGWTKGQHLLFVEQPVETGFSFSEDHALVDDEKHLARDFYGFLRNFLGVFDHLADRHLYIFGESYAGMYAPAIAREVLRQNAQPANKDKQINLKGIALGNGWVDSFRQTESYPVYAYAHGLIDGQARAWLQDEWDACLERLEGRLGVRAGDLAACRIMEKTLELAGGPNEYDIRTFNSYDYLVAADSAFSRFMNDVSVQRAIHVADSFPSFTSSWSWAVCNDRIVMAKDHPLSMAPVIAELLPSLRVMLYNGIEDLNCNALGTEAYLREMEWPGQQAWRQAPRALWRAGGEAAGYVKSLHNLSFVVVLNSGHLVPMDQPRAALDLVYSFTRGWSLADDPLPAPYLPATRGGGQLAEAGDGDGDDAQPLYTGVGAWAFVASLVGIVFVAVVAALMYGHFRPRTQGYEEVEGDEENA